MLPLPLLFNICIGGPSQCYKIRTNKWEEMGGLEALAALATWNKCAPISAFHCLLHLSLRITAPLADSLEMCPCQIGLSSSHEASNAIPEKCACWYLLVFSVGWMAFSIAVSGHPGLDQERRCHALSLADIGYWVLSCRKGSEILKFTVRGTQTLFLLHFLFLMSILGFTES